MLLSLILSVVDFHLTTQSTYGMPLLADSGSECDLSTVIPSESVSVLYKEVNGTPIWTNDPGQQEPGEAVMDSSDNWVHARITFYNYFMCPLP